MRQSAWTVALVLMASSGAWAQFRLPSLIGRWHPVPGQGALYQVTTSDGGHSTLEMDCVGREGDSVWFELTTTEGAEVTVIRQLLGPRGATKVAFKTAGQPAVEVPPDAVVEGGFPLDVVRQGHWLAHERIPIGHEIYVTDRYQLTDGTRTAWDVWVNSRVPPCDLVRLHSATITITLQKRLSHVHTRITESPQPLDLP